MKKKNSNDAKKIKKHHKENIFFYWLEEYHYSIKSNRIFADWWSHTQIHHALQIVAVTS